MALVVMALLSGIVTITTQVNLAYAASSEKIPLVQQYEQFPGQEVTGFCNVKVDDGGNLHWQIKVNGLVPGTQGHFDMGHWSGEVDVPYTADDDGKADSKNQIVLAANVPHSIFSQFAKCHVRTSGDSHFDDPGIALGVLVSSNADADENKKIIPPGKKSPKKYPPILAFGASNPSNVDTDESKKLIPPEKNFFLFYSFGHVLGIFTNNNVNTDESKKLIPPEKKSPPSSPPGLEKTWMDDAFEAVNSFIGPRLPPSNNPPTADDKFVSTPENTAKTITLTGSDVDGDGLTYSVIIGPLYGVVTGIAPNLTYTPNSDYNGSDRFTFNVHDGTTNSNTATVLIDVNAVGETPSYDDTVTVTKEGNGRDSGGKPSDKPGSKSSDKSSGRCNPGLHKKGLC